MSKWILASLAAAGLFVSFSAAQASEREEGCCGPIPPKYAYRDVEQTHHVTRYRDVTHPYYVDRRELFVHVTRVRPVVYIDEVTRVHEQPISRIIPEHVSQTEYLPAEHYVSHHTVYIQEPCECSDCR